MFKTTIALAADRGVAPVLEMEEVEPARAGQAVVARGPGDDMAAAVDPGQRSPSPLIAGP